MHSYETIIYEVRESAAQITLNRPEVRNAINHQMESEIKDALRRANDDPDVRGIMITGSEPAFCSGIDLRLHKGRTPLEARRHFEAFYWGFYTVHRALEKPTLAVLNGPAREAGCTIAFMCDMIIASDKASIGFPAIDRGIVPAYHLIHLPRIIGRLKAFEICFSGDPVDAEQAEQLGILNKVVAHADLKAEADRMLARFTGKPPHVMKIGKELFYRTMDMEFEKGLRTVADVTSLLAGMPDSLEGFSAYVEKREPQWIKDANVSKEE